MTARSTRWNCTRPAACCAASARLGNGRRRHGHGFRTAGAIACDAPAAAAGARGGEALMDPRAGYSLQQVLPPQVLVGGNAIWSRYQQYPVFSWRWLAGRSLLFCSLVLVATALIGVAVALAMQSVRVGVQVWGAQFVDFSPMAMLCPSLSS